jgi:hypothetical protein
MDESEYGPQALLEGTEHEYWVGAGVVGVGVVGLGVGVGVAPGLNNGDT